jgi:dTMP kinase
MQYKGKFITIEGIDGSGKSTLAIPLKGYIGKLTGMPVLLTKEPGGSQLGQQLRSILQTQPDPICDKAEYLLFAADRAQHYAQVILPALEQGKIVISDRWADSSVAYQGYGRGLDVNTIKAANAWATNNIEPDLTFYIKIDAKTAMTRVMLRNQNLTHFEQENVDFWNRVIHGYEELYTGRTNIIYLDGNLGPVQIFNCLREKQSEIENRLSVWKH